MSNDYLTELVGSEDGEKQLIDAFVKQANAEGLDLNQLSDEEVNDLYENGFKAKLAAAQAEQAVTTDSIIEKAAAEGASDEVLEKLALAKLSGEAMFEGYRERWEKFAQEAAMAEEAAPMPPEAAPEAMPAEGGGEPGVTEEEAKAIVEEAAAEAVEEVAAQAPPETSPEEIAAAAAEAVPEKVEEKVSEYLAWKKESQYKTAAALDLVKQALGTGELRDLHEAQFGGLKDTTEGMKTRRALGKFKGPTKQDRAEVRNLRKRTMKAMPLRMRLRKTLGTRIGKAGLIGAGAALAGLGGYATYKGLKKDDKGKGHKKAAALAILRDRLGE